MDQLAYRVKLLADKDTMKYNKGYGDNGSGCYYLTQEQAEHWFKNWDNPPQRYYSYLMNSLDGLPVGDVNIRYDEGRKLHMVGIVIEASRRGQGYAEEGLKLLAEKAFTDFGLNEIADDFPISRIAAERVFKKVGFIRRLDGLLILTKEDFLKLHTK